ncbi:uncharacterized protein LOC132394079 isoform X2 [Hypanus sabinus]|uniref:uncharacterized protein LOC132394079 isoform X2 n=1 Tax=Hypanus sabinus TaxID=79690 RepID=UPI0028C4F1DE|nr:uncharacterized protein LOC132394079 isoform X2 [Hypanus sabinus]
MSKDLSSVTILKTDTPRTRDLKTLRAKRLAYFVDRNHNCTNLSRDVGSLGPNDKQVNIDHRVALNAEQNVPLVEKECHINELIQHTRTEDTRQMHSRDLDTLLNISESDGKDACTPRPDYNFLENPSVSEIQKLRHIVCWAQEILKKDKNDSHTQDHQSTMNINERELAESHLNPAPQTTTFNCSSHTNTFVHNAAVSSAFDEAKCSAGISTESFNSFDLKRPHRNLVPISSFMTVQNDVQEQRTSTNIGLSSNCHFDSSNTFERKNTEQVHTYNASNNKWKFKDSGESKELMTELPNETCHSMTSNVSALNKGNYFWIPLEAGSDDEYITENRQVNGVFMEPFIKSNITPLLCSSNNNYYNNNGEPTLSARTVTLRKCPETYNNSGEILENPVNLHYMTKHHISSNNQNNNGEPTLSARAVMLKQSPVAYCDSSGDIFATPVNKHNVALYCKSTFCDEGKRNYAWETKKAEEYFSGGDYEISLGHSKLADVPGLSANLDDAGFNFKSPFAPKCIIESSNEKITRNKQDKGSKVEKASQGSANSDQFPEKFRNLCITDANKTLLSHSSGSLKYCSDIIMDSRWCENLPDLAILNKKANSNNDENEVRYQTTKYKAQNTLKLSPLPMLSSYDFNDSETSSIQFEKEEPLESVRSQIADENRSSFLHANNLVKCCPECRSDNSSTVNWCTECGCVLIGITPQHCNATSNIDGRAYSNSRGSSNKEKIVVVGLKEKSEIEEYKLDDVNNLENSTCFSLEICESQLSVYQKYLLYMEHLEKIRGQHQTREQQPTDVLLVKENTNLTETVDENNSSCGKHEPENSNTTSFILPTHFREQTDSTYIVYEQDSEDNPIPNPDIATVPLAENIPGVSTLHCTFQEKSYLEQDSNIETSKNILHNANLKQNFGNQNFSSLEYENNKETLKDAEKKPRKKRKIQSNINQYQRCWEKSSIAWSSYTQGAIKARSTNVSHPRSADCPRTKGKPLLPDDRSTVPMAMSKGSLNQPFKRPLSANILDNKRGRQERQRSKTLLQNAAVTSGPTMKPRELTKYLKSDASHSYDKLICPRDGNALRWLYLPDEIWIRIFTLLSHQDLFQVVQVCYRFYHLANDETLWKNIKVENCNCLNDECFKNIGHHKPQSLSLLRCDDRTGSITDSGLRLLFKYSKDSLKELYVSCCTGPKLTGDSILLHASAICHKLASVNVSWTAATDEGIIALTQASSCLYRLLANGCHLTDESINILVTKHGKSLKELELFGCHALSSQCLTHVAQECLNLQILNIGRIPKLTTACLTWIVTNLKDLSTLNLSGLNAVHDSVVHHIARHCPKMDRLILSSCPQMTDVSLFEIGTYLSTIRYLDICGCKKVTDTGVQALAMSCHKLQYLDLSSTAVGKYGICLLATYCNQNLECVKLSFCKEITEDAIKKLCKNSKRFRSLWAAL